MEYNTIADNDSMYNTPPTFSIYVLGLVLEWIDSMGGLEVMQKKNEEKAKLLYDYLDTSDFYKAHSDKDNRSLMNVTFTCCLLYTSNLHHNDQHHKQPDYE